VIAVDTNVIVRLLVGDDARQLERAARLFAGTSPIFIAKTVLLEAAWVLQSAYAFPRRKVVEALQRLGGLSNVIVEDAERVAHALRHADQGLDVADALHVASSLDAETFYTFDQRLIRQAATQGLAIAEPPQQGG
jgi:predicted nucleic-acid-binding protein